jgi:ABC-type Mn2+/Zn2+ transport system permease subunit
MTDMKKWLKILLYQLLTALISYVVGMFIFYKINIPQEPRLIFALGGSQLIQILMIKERDEIV